MIWSNSSNTTWNTNTSSSSGWFTIRIAAPAPPPPDPARVKVLLARAKRIYWQKAKKCHPDAGGSNEAMATLNAKYEEVVRRIETGEIR